MIKAIIFDLDGVIVSTDRYHYAAWKRIADREGIYFDEVINHRLRGVSRMESLEILLERAARSYTEEEKIRLANDKNAIYQQFLEQLSPNDILDDADQVIAELKRRNIKVAIGSSSKNTKRILEKIGLLEAFDAIADGTDITRSKPHPDVFLVAAERLGVCPSACAVVEDANSGIVAAKQAGMLAIAIGEARKSANADMRINHLSDLLKIKYDTI